MHAMTAPRFTLANLMAFILVFGVSGALLVNISRSIHRSRVMECQTNLRHLWQGQFNEAARGTNNCCGPLKTQIGGNYWVKLQISARPVVDRYERFFCPLSGERVVEGRTSYRGPYRNVHKLDDQDIVGADKEGHHGTGFGGNVLVKEGAIFEVAESDPAWIRARSTTQE
jgi:hypothetical protein